MCRFKPALFLTFLLGLSAIASCTTTPVVWMKDDYAADEVRLDLAECRRLAKDEAWRMDWERRWPPSFYDRHYMPPYYRWDRPFWYGYPSSLEREHDLRDFCMHSKGYRLTALPE